MLPRFTLASVSSTSITAGLLLTMTMLIGSDSRTAMTSSPKTTLLQVTLPPPPPPKPESEPPAPPPAPVPTPTGGPKGPQIFEPVRITGSPEGYGIGLSLVVDQGPLVIGLPSDGSQNSALVAVMTVQPIYPQRMLVRGIEGFVDVRYDVDTLGRAINGRVTASSHPGFESAALTALTRFRYQPRTVDGKTMRVDNLEKRFSFTIE